MLARELETARGSALLAEPLQGLDIRSRKDAMARIRELADRGTAVLLLTSSVDDALELADRVIALYRGQAVLEVESAGATAKDIVSAMAGSAGAA
jgi:ABC-type uncharacterized transport system ATPase subunit